MHAALVRHVWERAGARCEYCRMPQELDEATFEIDHITPRKHGGPTLLANLALSCFHCNSHKGPNVGGLAIGTRKITPLFHPRRHSWTHHFRWDGTTLVGRTTIGRVTITVLGINDRFRVALREALIRERLFPPR